MSFADRLGAHTARVKWTVATVSALVLAAPFVAVAFPPITDLPQHAAQIRLFLQAVSEGAPELEVYWNTPYGGVYLVMAACWAAFGPLAAGRVTLLLICLASTLAIHWFAARRGRPTGNAVLASMLVYSHVLYWGFYQFLSGWPVFLLWVLAVDSEERHNPRRLVFSGVLALVLYFSHIFWYLLGICWLAARLLRRRPAPRDLLVQLLAILPSVVLCSCWYARFATGRFDSPTVYLTGIVERLDPSWMADAVFGGLRGAVEPLMLVLMLGWCCVALYQHRGSWRTKIDPELALLGGALLLAALVLPHKFHNVIRFGTRWAPFGMALLLLALPAPRIKRALELLIPLVALLGFTFATTTAWVDFERSEMSGIEEAIERTPAEARVVGLDYVQTSEIVKSDPFIHAFAYVSVVRPATLNFSFADFGTSPVVYAGGGRELPWTMGIEWVATRLTKRDLTYFDFAFVNAREPLHRQLASSPELRSLSTAGRFRLYRVVPER